MKIGEVREGRARILVPEEAIEGDPSRAPVFYNPRMERNRTVSVLVVRSYGGLLGRGMTICEPLSGTGVRSIRYALEVPHASRVIANDVSWQAYRLIKANVELNGVNDVVEVHRRDGASLMAELWNVCDVVDVDPFGTPMPFLSAAIMAVRHGGMLCVTATDLAVLMGNYPRKCLSRYGAHVARVPFSRELGLRVLLAAVGRQAAALDAGIEPMVSFWDGHYYRLCVLVYKDVTSAKDTVDNMGYAYYREGERGLVAGYPKAPGGDMGPIWVGKLGDVEFAGMVSEEAVGPYQGQRRLLESLYNEYMAPPLYYLTHEVAVRGREPPLGLVLETVRGTGVDAWATHFSSRGFKVGARLSYLRALMSSAAW